MGGDPLKKYPHDKLRNRIYVSREFAEFCGCPDHPVVHSIVHPMPSVVPLGKGDGGYALYVGTIRPEKGVLEAERACARVGLPLKVAGPIRDLDYWDRIRDRVEYIGILPNDKSRDDVFGQAAVFMYCPKWCDAGPLAPMEAMLRGTPVAGYANGGLASDVEDDVGGWLVRKDNPTIDDLAGAIERARTVDRAGVREAILPKIDPHKCAERLVLLCQQVADGKSW